MNKLEKELLEKIKKSKAEGRFAVIKQGQRKPTNHGDVDDKANLGGVAIHSGWAGGWKGGRIEEGHDEANKWRVKNE